MEKRWDHALVSGSSYPESCECSNTVGCQQGASATLPGPPIPAKRPKVGMSTHLYQGGELVLRAGQPLAPDQPAECAWLRSVTGLRPGCLLGRVIPSLPDFHPVASR